MDTAKKAPLRVRRDHPLATETEETEAATAEAVVATVEVAAEIVVAAAAEIVAVAAAVIADQEDNLHKKMSLLTGGFFFGEEQRA